MEMEQILYMEILKRLGLFSLERRQLRVDMTRYNKKNPQP